METSPIPSYIVLLVLWLVDLIVHNNLLTYLTIQVKICLHYVSSNQPQ